MPRPAGLRSVTIVREPGAAFADARLAALYDVLEGDRSDLDAYVAISQEARARSVVDVGCGTGSLATLLVRRGMNVVGVDPAAASLDVARAKPDGERVQWVLGDATALLDRRLHADLAVMTANVAQEIVADFDWHQTLRAIRASLRPAGWLAFETRRPDARAWEQWDMPPSRFDLPDGASAVVSRRVREVALPLVTFESEVIIDGEVLRSSSTLRFRNQEEVERDLVEHDFRVVDVRDAADRPGKEYVFLTRKRH